MGHDEFVGGNYFDKYKSTNPIHRWLMDRFLRSAKQLIGNLNPSCVIEAGCGPGDLAASLMPSLPGCVSYKGIDIDPVQVETARSQLPQLEFQVASIYELPFDTSSADLVIACEVLEHVDDPRKAIEEIFRVSRRWALVSVPWEPTWRILNFMRGKYLAQLGNTPGHVQHFSRRRIRRLLAEKFTVKQELHPLPWTMFLLEAKKQ